MVFSDIRGRRRLSVIATGLATAALAFSSIGVAADSHETTLRSNYSDPVVKEAIAEMMAYCTEQTGIEVSINTIQHEDYQEQFSQALQADPEDIIAWFAGFRMRFFADQGLFSPITDIWGEFGDNYSEAFKNAVTGNDGEQYMVPVYNYGWVLNYKPSVFEANGWEVPTTLEELKAVGDDALAKDIVPIAFADQQFWPAMGWFDILNMRQNGYQFHVDLMAGEEKWTDPRVKAVFETWRDLMPYMQPGALGRDWQEAAQAVLNEEAAMMLIGFGQYGEQIPVYAGPDATAEELDAQYADHGFVPFVTLGTEFDTELGIDAPIDGFVLGPNPKNPEGAKEILKCLATGAAQNIYTAANPTNVAAALDADTSLYSPTQLGGAEIIANAGGIAQFLDRDTRPEFSGPQAMGGFIKEFIGDPEQDLDTFLQQIQDTWDTLPPL
jgi:multiple sugar transport system substrate-binding protein